MRLFKTRSHTSERRGYEADKKRIHKKGKKGGYEADKKRIHKKGKKGGLSVRDKRNVKESHRHIT